MPHLKTISVTFEVRLLWAFKKTLLQPFLSPSFSLCTYSWEFWSRCQKQIQLTQRNVQSHTIGCLLNCFLFHASSQVWKQPHCCVSFQYTNQHFQFPKPPYHLKSHNISRNLNVAADSHLWGRLNCWFFYACACLTVASKYVVFPTQRQEGWQQTCDRKAMQGICELALRRWERQSTESQRSDSEMSLSLWEYL